MISGLTYNISYSFASIIIGVVLFLIISLNYSTTNLVNKRFRYFLIATIVMYVLDALTAITNDYAKNVAIPLNIVLNSLYFFSGSVVAILFLYYCISVAFPDTSPSFRKKFYIINLSILGIYLISLIVNAFTGFYFYFSPTEYIRNKPVYYLVNLLSLGYTFESIFIFLIKRKRFNKRQTLCNALFYASFLLSFILQSFVFTEVLLSDFGCAIGSLIIFFSMETPDYAKLMVTLNELNELKGSLEIQVQNRTMELDKEKESYEQLTLETLSSLALVIDAKDHYTNGHSFRVAAYAKGMAKMLNFSFADAEQLYFAGLIHDVGKIGIKESILTKPGKLTDQEYAIIKSHSSLGGEILKGIHQFKIFEQVARSHHERYDGTGYPDKLKGEDIPYPARIVTICDTFDAMTSDRSYRKALSDEKAIKELITYKGTQFDPELVDVFLKLYNSFPDTIRNHIDELKK